MPYRKPPSLLGAECQGAETTPFHTNERGQTVRFVAVIAPQFTGGVSIRNCTLQCKESISSLFIKKEDITVFEFLVQSLVPDLVFSAG